MKRSILTGLFLLIPCAAMLSRPASPQDGKNQFVGAWRLKWLEQEGADGKVERANCTGLLVYTRDGHMSVQVMFLGPPETGEVNHAPVQYAQGGYEASFGIYKIDEGGKTFTYHVEGALVRSLVGKDLPRAFELTGKQLIVTPASPQEHWRVAWERDREN